MKLSTKTIQALRPTDRRQEIKDDGCRGLYLLIQPSGSKVWAVRYSLDSKLRKATLGSFTAIGLAEARTAAGKIFEQLAGDIDPREAERQAAAEAKAARARTFGKIARRFLDTGCDHLRPGSKRNIESALRLVIAEWQDRPIATIKRRDAIELVDCIKAERGPGAATKAQAWLRRVFNWMLEKDEIEASPIAGMKAPARLQPRDRVLSDDELRRLWVACDQRPHPFGRYVQLLLLTACRRMELATLRWSDVDFGERTIIVPGSRYKTGKPHLIPLSRQALRIIEGLPRLDDVYVFPGRGGGKPLAAFTQHKTRLDALLDPPIDYNLHDTRRTCRTGLSRLRVPPHIAERVLGHAQQGIERVYDVHSYADEKRQALQLWADHVTRIVEGDGATNNVVTMVR